MPRLIKVLLVDDRELVRQTIRSSLTGFECELVEADDGETALRQLAAVRFDVIFLDLRLPDLPGPEVLRRAREDGLVKGKVIVLTGLPEPATRAEAERLGVLRYLEKNPIDFASVREAFLEAAPGAIQSSVVPRKATTTPGMHEAKLRSRRRGKEVEAPSLLVLDNDPSWLETMARSLGQKFSLTLTTSANEACRRARRENFDLVVLDMLLVDGVTGLDVLSRMRRARPDLRAIILTGQPDAEAAFEAAKWGALRYVSKGALDELPDMVMKLLREGDRALSVFLSYAREDWKRVSHWHRRLLAEGFLPWMDTMNIAGSVKWRPEIEKAIATCDRFVFFASRHSIECEGALWKEVRMALFRQSLLQDSSVFLIPARLDDCRLEDPLGKLARVDLFKRDGAIRLITALTGRTKGSFSLPT
jgi:ActR/RegA family two-component response regulator